MGRVLLPIETKSREFFGKTWLAIHLAERGHEVIIGDKAPIYSRYKELEPDIFIEKSAFAGDHHYNRITELSEAGCSVVFLDEEGGVFTSKESYTEIRSNRLINQFHHIFAWGDAQAQALSNFSGYPSSQITITGNPRFDLLHHNLREVYLEKADRIRSTYGDFVLFNTNFAAANHPNPRKLDPEADQYQHILAVREKVERLISIFVDAVRHLSEIDEERNIVIRPHPSEDPTTYEKQFDNYENVYVDWSGDVREWILASSAVVHNSCTTGIESALMGVPTFALLDTEFEARVKLPNKVSSCVTSSKLLASKILEDGHKEHTIDKDAKYHLQKFFYNVDQKAAPVIAEKIDELIDESSNIRLESDYAPYHNWSDFKKSPLGRSLKSVRYKIGKKPLSRKKFSGIDYSEMRQVVNKLANLTNKSKPEVEKVNRWEDLYAVQF